MKILNKLILLMAVLFLMNGCDHTNKVEKSLDMDYYTLEDCVDDYSLDDLEELQNQGRKTIFLVWHCTASPEGRDLKGSWFMDFFHKDLGWIKPGYNEIVELDGNSFLSNPYNLDGITTYDEIVNGAKGYNSVSIHFAYVGGVDKNMKPKDTRTKAQKKTMWEMTCRVKEAIPNIIVIGHRELPNVAKACPSFGVQSEYGVSSVSEQEELFDIPAEKLIEKFGKLDN